MCVSIWSQERRDRCLALWGAGLLLYGVVSATVPLLPSAWIWNSISYSALEVGVLLFWGGFRSFDGKPAFTRPLLCLPLAPVGVCLVYGLLSGNWAEGNRAALLAHCTIAAALATYTIQGRLNWRCPRAMAAYSMYLIAASVAGPALLEGSWLSPITTEIFIALVDHVMTIVFTLSVIATVGLRDFQKAARAARVDPLTGALNRMGLAEALAHMTSPQTLMLVDLDHFKVINDRFGHDCGDEVLRDFTDRASATIGDAALLARLGGEEFLIVSGDRCMDSATCLAEAVRLAACSEPVRAGEASIPYTVSIGVTLRAGQEEFQHAVKRADDALYRAKATGRDRVVTC
jgi:diguanylate cyclase (GGDEF)-like protein